MSFDLNFFNNDLFVVPSLTEPLSAGMGSNEKGILVICNDFSINEGQKDFLSKILAAVNCSIEKDVMVLDLDLQKLPHWANIQQSINFNKVLIFSINPEDLGLRLKLERYQLATWNKVQFLRADALAEIQNDKVKKQLLWQALQELFK